VKPTKEKTSVALPAGAAIEYFPLGSDNAPIVVPLTRIVTPVIGCPPWSVMTPVIGIWAIRLRLAKSNKINKTPRLIIVFGF
jgi:hypothetical protein